MVKVSLVELPSLVWESWWAQGRGVEESGVSRELSLLFLVHLYVHKLTLIASSLIVSSDNELVDGGIATAAEVGTYNDKFGWGLGVENMGVSPDIEVDNNPASAFKGEDTQLERAISVLKDWLAEEPIVLPKQPGPREDKSKKEGIDGCSA